MWPLAVVFGPVGWAVAAVGTVATIYAVSKSDNEYETSSYGNRGESEAEAVNATLKEQNNKLYQDIKAYKSKQVKRFKDKYNVDIEFYSGKSKSSSGMFGLAGVAMAKGLLEIDLSDKISVSKDNEVDTISILEQETEEMIKLIGQLEVKKYETTN